jgi:molybdenum cofactor biosynthesis protein A
MLIDGFNRIQNYLRISLTDSCNFRCTYCMPNKEHAFLPNEKLMSPGEIEAITREFVGLGIRKIKLTGGEPLVRKDFQEIICRLAQFPVELTLITNGALVHHHIDALKKAGIQSVNISLDSLNPKTFLSITQRNQFQQVWENIMLLLRQDFRIKINVVAIQGHIENELMQFVELTRNSPLHVRFIEFMPFLGNKWNSSKVITAQTMLEMVKSELDIVKLKDEPHSTAKKFKVIGYEGSFAFITTMSDQFCGECNRLRITAEGKMKNCLFGKEEIDLLGALRKGDAIMQLIIQSVQNKKAAMGGQFVEGYENTKPETILNRSMVAIGG